jgi:hypothetical protein
MDVNPDNFFASTNESLSYLHNNYVNTMCYKCKSFQQNSVQIS